MMLFLLIVVPLVVGRVLQRIIPEHAPKLGLWLGRLSIVIFIIAAVTAGQIQVAGDQVDGSRTGSQRSFS